jgi:magnesium-transporting ATPase (P-type)
MLTGDKLETAENIGYSCKLLTKDMIVWKISNQKETLKIVIFVMGHLELNAVLPDALLRLSESPNRWKSAK